MADALGVTKDELAAFVVKLRGPKYAKYPPTYATWLCRAANGLCLKNSQWKPLFTDVVCSVPNGMDAPGVAEWIEAGMPGAKRPPD
jgi:hypothetical protein